MKILKPTLKKENIESINITEILDKNYSIIFFDLNNTIIDYYTDTIPEETKKFIYNLMEQNINIYIITNSFKTDLLKSVAKKLKVKYVNKAFKPLPFSILKILKKEKISNSNALFIGDHIFTDILAANLCKIDSILVKPLNYNEKYHSKIVRKIENMISK